MNLRVPLLRKTPPRSRRQLDMPVQDILNPDLDGAQSRWYKEQWKSIYQRQNLDRLIYRYRQAAALRMVDELDLPKESSALEVGCGSGILTIALARRSYIVHAIDRVKASVDLVHRRAMEVGLTSSIITGIGDVQALAFKDESFNLVLALGVVPWLRSPEAAMTEIGRVLKPGGSAIITVVNRWRLNRMLDPRFSPFFSPIRDFITSILEALSLKRPDRRSSFPRTYSLHEVNALVHSLGLQLSAGRTLAFGPFTLLGKRVFPDAVGKLVHRFLQSMADRNVPGIRATGSHYLVVMQKPDRVSGGSYARDEALVGNEHHNWSNE